MALTFQIPLDFAEVLGQVLKLDQGGLVDLAGLWQGKLRLLCPGMLPSKTTFESRQIKSEGNRRPRRGALAEAITLGPTRLPDYSLCRSEHCAHLLMYHAINSQPVG